MALGQVFSPPYPLSKAKLITTIGQVSSPPGFSSIPLPYPLGNAQAKCGNLLRQLVLRWYDGIENGILINTLNRSENVYHYMNLVWTWGNEQRDCHECSTLGPPGRVLCSACTEKLVSLGNMAKLYDAPEAQKPYYWATLNNGVEA